MTSRESKIEPNIRNIIGLINELKLFTVTIILYKIIERHRCAQRESFHQVEREMKGGYQFHAKTLYSAMKLCQSFASARQRCEVTPQRRIVYWVKRM